MSFDGVVYRHYAPTYGALNGEGARRLGGRWNPPESYATLYTATDVETVDAEFDRLLASARLSPASVRPRDLAAIHLRLSRVVDLRQEVVRNALGVTLEDLVGESTAVTRAIGEGAHHLGYEAVLAPSAAGPGSVVALFLTNRAVDSEIEVIEESRYERAYPPERGDE